MRAAAKKIAYSMLKHAGYGLEPRHFYSPVPVVEELRSDLWDRPSDLPGVDLKVADAVALLGVLGPYLAEFAVPFDRDGPGFWLNNRNYGDVDAPILYAMVRHFKPRRVIELGSGASSHVIGMGRQVNATEDRPLAHSVFDPFPFQATPMGALDGIDVHVARTEDLGWDTFAELQANDILFVDTTHTVKTGGDVVHLFQEIFPRLQSGVLVHVHDIFLPYQYPKTWVIEQRRAWAEQYLLAAFLAFNIAFEVLFPAYAVSREQPDALRGAIPSFNSDVSPGAFWMVRT
jgi:hypothetical protein